MTQAPVPTVPEPADASRDVPVHPELAGPKGFEVTLENFAGPFDLLLGLISKHEMDITEIALARVTDEFIAYIRDLQEAGHGWALDEASEFLVIAATLLDLKAARLLPAGDVEDDEDVALLEARDLLFARLLQYKAFKEAAGFIDERLMAESARFPRAVSLEPQFAALLPELIWRTTPADLASLAAKALAPKDPEPAGVGLGHLHAPAVSVQEQAELLGRRLAAGEALTFADLSVDADSTLVVVARFLALLEMYRDAVVTFEQVSPLGELTIRWTGEYERWSSEGIGADFDAGTAGDSRDDARDEGTADERRR